MRYQVNFALCKLGSLHFSHRLHIGYGSIILLNIDTASKIGVKARRKANFAIFISRFTFSPFHSLKVIVGYHIKGLLVVADKLHLLPALLAFENVVRLIQYRTKVFYKLLKPCLDLTAGLHYLIGKAFALLILTALSGIYRFSKIKRSKSNYIFYKFGLV